MIRAQRDSSSGRAVTVTSLVLTVWMGSDCRCERMGQRDYCRYFTKVRRGCSRRRWAIDDKGAGTESVPWLETMGWQRYLGALERGSLLSLVAAPDEKQETVLATICQALDELLEHCQQTVTDRAGYYARMEAVRTEQSQTKYWPLQAYIDRMTVTDYARPWKVMVALFYRTRGPQKRGVPKYRLSKDQRRQLTNLTRVARRGMTYKRE